MHKVELLAPAGNLPALKVAVDVGADAVYIGFSGDTNLRNFPGLNFTPDEVVEGIRYAHQRGKRVFVTVNAYPQKKEMDASQRAVDEAYGSGADAVIASDVAVLAYARKRHPDRRLHLSVQASASNARAIAFYKRHFGIERVVLPRVLTLKEIAAIRMQTDVELEVFAAGLLCINTEGQCFLSSYITSESINTYGACSHPKFVRFEGPSLEKTADRGVTLRILSNGVLLNEVQAGEETSYPTPCKGRYVNRATGRTDFAIQDPESLNVLDILPNVVASGIHSLKLEGRQRSRSYVETVVKTYRQALDACYEGHYDPAQFSQGALHSSFEGLAPSVGCYSGK
jgi:putative protease